MALQIAAVANSIAALSVSGIVMKDIDEIPIAVGVRSSQIIPLPDYVTDFVMERDSFGMGSAKMTVHYTLNYRLLYKKVGVGRQNVIANFADMIAKCALWWDAVMAIDTFTGGVDIEPAGIRNMGNVNDPSDEIYVGCDISVRVQEFVN